LTLDPGAEEELIVCSLNTHSLTNLGVEYEALSYTWGSEADKAEIRVNNRSMPVTRNLFEALKALRLPDKQRVLWIDAICINQTDLRERDSQVNIMRHIYKGARAVIVWLGPAADNSLSALDLLVKLSTIREKRHDFGSYGVILRQALSSAGLPDFEDADGKALKLLLERPWVRRVWVIQEVAVSKTSTVLCGDGETSWDVMANAARAIHEAQLMVLLGDGYKHVSRLQAFREAIAAGMELPLTMLLLSAVACQATDPRDKIFSMLGMATDVIQPGKPDGLRIAAKYEKTPPEVFIDFAKECIDYFDALDVLAGKLFEAEESKLPSWVPNWSMDLICTPLMIRASPSGYNACKSHGARCSYGENGRNLYIHGIMFDQVANVGRAMVEPGPGQNIDDVNIYLEWANLAGNLKFYPGDIGVDEAYFRTLLQTQTAVPTKLVMITALHFCRGIDFCIKLRKWRFQNTYGTQRLVSRKKIPEQLSSIMLRFEFVMDAVTS
jgi:hypothetical protein